MDAPIAARKLDLVEQAEQIATEAGIGLIPLALGFTLAHPAVSSTIIGPRNMDQLESQLPAGDLRLDDDVLDALDALVPPGTDVDPDDTYYVPPAIQHASLRRLSPSPLDGGDGRVRGRRPTSSHREHEPAEEPVSNGP